MISVGYTLRLATKNPDVTWNRHTNPEPWQEYEKKNYKVRLTFYPGMMKIHSSRTVFPPLCSLI